MPSLSGVNEVVIYSKPQDFDGITHIVMPGVGAFEDGMKDLRANNLDNAIKEFVQTDRPLLGICLGMQLFMTNSEENGHHDGLNIIKGRVVRFKDPNDHSNNYKIPQIGWNALSPPNNKRNVLDKKHWDNSILKSFDDLSFEINSTFIFLKKHIKKAKMTKKRDLLVRDLLARDLLVRDLLVSLRVRYAVFIPTPGFEPGTFGS